jgi:hypothetical protein
LPGGCRINLDPHCQSCHRRRQWLELGGSVELRGVQAGRPGPVYWEFVLNVYQAWNVVLDFVRTKLADDMGEWFSFAAKDEGMPILQT